jgi:sulfite exporter TauE/SafE
VNTLLFTSALLMGLLGSSHCVMMCGGVVAVSCSALPLGRRSRLLAQVPYLVAYNAGRIVSYSVAGGLAGLVGASLTSFGSVQGAQIAMRIAAAAMLVAVGFYVAGLAPALRWVERVGAPLWNLVAPVGRHFVPVRRPAHALALGLLWGWMPCGLVYAALSAAVSSGSAARGMVTMAAFGLGTLPTLLTMGSAAAGVARFGRHRWARGGAGIAMIALGVLQTVEWGARWGELGGRSSASCCIPHHHVPQAR